MSTVAHPIFARTWRLLSRCIEHEVGPYRREVLSGLHGRVLEIGAGDGRNFALYPGGVSEVVALEPEAYLRAAAQRAATSAPVPVTVSDGVAERLPFADGAFDTALSCLVLCAVADPPGALAELRRVIKPGGALHFFEHVRSDQPGKAGVQERFDRFGVWPLVAGGCHCARDTVGAIAGAGFTVEHSRSLDGGPSWGLTNPMVIGLARR